jgi:DNA relaxase NicK
MVFIDYVTASLGASGSARTTTDVLEMFSQPLPASFKETSRDAILSEGSSARVQQYGICASSQYGSGLQHGWYFSVQLSGDYWEAIGRSRETVLRVLNNFSQWRISRLDLAADVIVPLEDWQAYLKGAFDAGEYSLSGKQDARTVYYGSRKSQFFTRVYCKSAQDPVNYSAEKDKAVIRFEVEIHRVRGEVILQRAFENSEFATQLFAQRVRAVKQNDTTGFIEKYFDCDPKHKIKTVQRVMGDFEKTVEYVFKTYAPYIAAGLKETELLKKSYVVDPEKHKVEKVIQVLKHKSENKANNETLLD